MILKGKNIYLKKGLSKENYPRLLEWFQNVELVAYLYSAQELSNFRTIEEVERFLKEDDPDEMFFEIYSKNEKQFIGYASFCAFNDNLKECEFSIFVFDKNYWGKGIGEEVTKIMLDYGFSELGMSRIILETSELHSRAIRLYEKCGFRKIEIVPDDRTVFHEGKWVRSGSLIMEIKPS